MFINIATLILYDSLSLYKCILCSAFRSTTLLGWKIHLYARVQEKGPACPKRNTALPNSRGFTKCVFFSFGEGNVMVVFMNTVFESREVTHTY